MHYIATGKELKKERTNNKPKFATFIDSLPIVPRQQNFACRVISRVSFLVLNFRKISWKMWELWRGRNFGLPVDLAHHLYNSLLLPHKPWSIQSTFQPLSIFNNMYSKY